MKIPKAKLIEYLDSIESEYIETNKIHDIINSCNQELKLCPNHIHEVNDLDIDYLGLYISTGECENLTEKLSPKINKLFKANECDLYGFEYMLRVSYEHHKDLNDEHYFDEQLLMAKTTIIDDETIYEWISFDEFKKFFGANFELCLPKLIHALQNHGFNLTLDNMPTELKKIMTLT